MVWLYLISLIPLVTGGYVYLKSKEFSWVEWLIVGSVGFVLAGIFHVCIVKGMTDDVEIWSGEITSAIYYPRWIEEYQEAHTSTSTDSKGNTTSYTYYTTEHRTHERYWEAHTSLNVEHRISETEFNDIRSKFNDLTTTRPYKSGFDGGDRNIYTSHNKTGYVFPATCTRTFENKIKASPSLFSFPKVPGFVKVFEYPECPNWRKSNRLLGEALKKFNVEKFDKLNADLGPLKHVNLIIVGFPPGSSNQDAEWQRAKWIGGKKNDLVICYGGDCDKAQWCTVFGWTEEELVKRNIETLFVNNKIGDNLFPAIRKEVVAHYQIKDWTKFDYLSVEPPTWAIILFVIVLFLVEGGVIWWALNNNLRDGCYWRNYGY